VPEDVDCCVIALKDVIASGAKSFDDASTVEWLDGSPLESTDAKALLRPVRLDKLLVKAGLATSNTDAARQIEHNAVRINKNAIRHVVGFILVNSEKVVTLGKKIKRIVISE
jgi:ribosomal protein S4